MHCVPLAHFIVMHPVIAGVTPHRLPLQTPVGHGARTHAITQSRSERHALPSGSGSVGGGFGVVGFGVVGFGVVGFGVVGSGVAGMVPIGDGGCDTGSIGAGLIGAGSGGTAGVAAPGAGSWVSVERGAFSQPAVTIAISTTAPSLDPIGDHSAFEA